MRHILKFNEATDWKKETIPSNIMQDIVNISYELKDEGYDVSFQWWPPYERHSPHWSKNKYPRITITKFNSKGPQLFNQIDIIDFIERVREYLGDNGFNIQVMSKRSMPVGSEFKDVKDPYVVANGETLGTYDGIYSTEFRINMINQEIYGKETFN